jgi:S-formylglutathione hydrolase FrmB
VCTGVADVSGAVAIWRIIIACLAAGLVVARAEPAESRETEIHPGVWEIEFYSTTLKAARKFCVAPPAEGARAAADWPVLFWLHGRGRSHRSLVDVDAMRTAFRDAPFCTVFPQGDDGWYIDSPVRPEDRYEAYLEEVLAVAARVRPLTRDPARRGITGWSMGGYGAVRFATRHPQDFGVVAAIIGLLDFPRAADLPDGQNYLTPVARFGADPAIWARFNPLHEAAVLRNHAIFIVTATEAFDRTMNERFHDTLLRLKIPHDYLVLPGAHTFPVVQMAAPRVIEFVGRHFAAPASLPQR